MKLKARRRVGGALLAAGMAVLLTLYALASLFTTDDILLSWETDFYKELDASLGVAAGWDWTMLFFASVWWIVIAAVLLFLIILQVNWRTRREHFGRAYGYFFATLAFMIISAALMDNLSADMRRPAPWRLLYHHHHMLEQGHDVKMIHLSRFTDVLEEVTYGWTFLTIVLGIRFRRAGLYSAIGLFLFTLSNLVIGKQWLTTLLVSSSLGVVAAGIWTVGWRKPLSWIERKAEVIFVHYFWRYLQPEDMLAATAAGAAALAGPLAREQRLRLLRKRDYWTEIVNSDVMPLVSSGREGFEIFQNPPVVEGAKSSPSTYVRFVRLAGGAMFVVKSVQRRNSLVGTPSRILKYVRSARTSMALRSHGICVPEVFWASESVLRWGLFRRFVSVEQYLQARPLRLTSAEELDGAMRLLAQVHEVKSAHWGPLDADGAEGFSSYIYRDAQQHLTFWLRRLMDRRSVLIENSEIDALWRRLEGHLLRRRNLNETFRLTHGDITEKNILRAADGKCYLIDFVDVRFDLAAIEIMKGVLHLCRELPGARTHSLESYFQARGAGAWEEFLAEAPYAFPMFAYRELTQGRIDVAPIEESAKRSAAVLHWMQRACDVGERAWGASPAATNWAMIDALLAGVDASYIEPVAQEAGEKARRVFARRDLKQVSEVRTLLIIASASWLRRYDWDFLH